MNLKQSSVALLEKAIDDKIRKSQSKRDTTLATVTRIDNDGTTWVHVYGGADETPVRHMTSAASVGDVINVTFSGLSCSGVGNVSSPSASQKQVQQLSSETASAIKGVMGGVLQLKTLIADKVATRELDAEIANILTASIENATIRTLNAMYADINAANINTAAIQDAWVDKLLVQTNLLANDGTVFTLDAVQVDAANITTGTLDVRRLIITRTVDGVDQKYLVEIDPETSQPSYVKMDGDVLGSHTVSADKLVAHSITANELTIQNIVGTGGWINLANGTFSYGNQATGEGISWDGSQLNITGAVRIGSSRKQLSDMLTAEDVTVTQNQTQTGYDVDIAGNTFSLVNGEDGQPGATGPQGPQGEQGIQGPAGTSVTISKIEYATSTTESQPSSGWSTTAPSTVAEGSWLWVKTTYSDGTTAVTRAKQGKSGTNGTSYYTHVRYSESADGTGHVASPTSATKYIGVYTGTSSSAPSSKASYKWSKYVGEDGAAGHSPSITTSHSGTTTTIYADGTAIGTVEDGEDGATPTITASKSGGTTTVKVNGSTIATINDGTSVTVSKVEYGTSSSASTSPSSWSTTAPTSITKGKWLWVKTTYSDNSTATTKSYVGTDGEDGKSVYVSSSTKVDGITTVVLSDGTTTTTIQIADGEDGENGQPGAAGDDSYVHFAWANSADGATDFSTTVSAGKLYMGVYSDNTLADSQTPSDYSWTLIKGEQGIQGPQGQAGATGPTAQWYYGTALTHTSGTATLATSSTAGVVVGAMYLNKNTSLCYKCTAISGTTATWAYAGNLTDGVMDNIEVGGRNLLFGTDDWSNWTRSSNVSVSDGIATYASQTSLAWNNIKRVHIPIADVTGNTLTLSFDYRSDDFSDASGDRYVYVNMYSSATVGGTRTKYRRLSKSSSVVSGSDYLFVPTTTWQRASLTFVFTGTSFFDAGSGDANYVGIEFYNHTLNHLQIRKPKLERGNVATDWTHAPEDAVDEEQYIYIQAVQNAVSTNAPTEWVEYSSECTTATETDGTTTWSTPVWSTKRPTFCPAYPTVLVAKQRRLVGGTVTCTTPLIDDTTTVIDGGRLITDSVTANAIDATDLHVQAANIDGTLTASQINTEWFELEVTAIAGLGDQLSSISGELSGKASSEDVSALSSTVSGMSETVETALGDGGTVEKLRSDMDNIQAHISLGTIGEGSSLQPAITLDAQGGSSDGFRNVITNTSMSFMYGNETVAEVNKDELDITRTKVTESMQLGNFMWIPLSDGSLAFKWVED